MTMNFRLIKASVVNLLGAAEGGRYRTIGYQKPGQGESEVKNNDRSVQVYYSSGDFSKSGGGVAGSSTSHEITINFDLTVSKPALVDLSIIQNPASTPAQIQGALAALQEASDLADNSFDELADIIYQEIMDARNVDLGLARPVGSRWISGINKDDPLPRGKLVVLTGSMQLTCKIDEQVTGATPEPAVPPAIDVDNKFYQPDSATADKAEAGVLTGG